MSERREVIIYEIVGRKIGQSRQGAFRPIQQLKENEKWCILQTIPPNTLTQREVWETECEWQMRKGYSVENEGNWKRLHHTLNEDRNLIQQKTNLTKSNSDWSETTGKPAARRAADKRKYNQDVINAKISEKKRSAEWIKEVEPVRLSKFLDTIHSEEWQKENFIECPHCLLKIMPGGGYNNHIDRCHKNPNRSYDPIHDQEMMAIIGKKVSETRKSPEWKEANHKICPDCGKGPMDPGNYAKHIRKHSLNRE
jgi:hypothetical protein